MCVVRSQANMPGYCVLSTVTAALSDRLNLAVTASIGVLTVFAVLLFLPISRLSNFTKIIPFNLSSVLIFISVIVPEAPFTSPSSMSIFLVKIHLAPMATSTIYGSPPVLCGPLWVRGCRIGPTYPPACRKRRLIGGSLFAVGCDPCQWKRGSWLLSQFFVAALRRQYTALASISLSRKVKMAWLNQSAGSAKP